MNKLATYTIFALLIIFSGSIYTFAQKKQNNVNVPLNNKNILLDKPNIQVNPQINPPRNLQIKPKNNSPSNTPSNNPRGSSGISVDSITIPPPDPDDPNKPRRNRPNTPRVPTNKPKDRVDNIPEISIPDEVPEIEEVPQIDERRPEPFEIPDEVPDIVPEIDTEDYISPIYKDKIFDSNIDENAEYIPDQILILLEGIKPKNSKINKLESNYKLDENGIHPLDSIDATLVVFNVLDKQKLPPLIKKINTDSEIIIAQPNYFYKSLSEKKLQYGVHKINADSAHKISTGKGVKVGIIDTGIDYNHKVLKNKVIIKKNFVDSGLSNFNLDPHGTSIAGIIAASADSSGKILGISPDVKLIAAKACWSTTQNSSSATCSTDKLARATNYVVINGSDIVNFSLGGPRDGIIKILIKKAVNKGITFIAASGNGGLKGKPVYPAALEEVIAVSATDLNDKLYYKSTRGNYVDLSAPGVDIISPAPGNKWQILSGTSMAAAHVSGATALLIQKYPELSPIQIKFVLSSSSVDLGKPGKDSKYGEGRIDVHKALKKLELNTAKNL